MAYVCSHCQAEVPAAAALTQRYQCAACGQGALLVRGARPAVLRAMPAETVALPAPVPAPPAPPAPAPRTLAEALRAALAVARPETAPPGADSDEAASPLPQEPAMIAVRVLPPPHNLRDAAAMEQLAGTLAHLPGPVALEIAGQGQARQLVVRGEPEALRQVVAQLRSVYRQLEVEPLPADEDAAEAVAAAPARAAVQLAPARPDFLALKTWQEFVDHEPLDALLGALDDLAPEEAALAQVIVRGAAPADWARPHLQRLAALQRRGYGVEAPAPLRHIVSWTLGAALSLALGVLVLWAYSGGDPSRWGWAGPLALGLGAVAVLAFNWGRLPWDEALEAEAAAKLREQAFEVEIRLFAGAATAARAQSRLEHLLAVYGLFNTTSGNRLAAAPLAAIAPLDLAPDIAQRPAVLNVRELAGLWHMPVGESLERVQRQAYERLVPVAAAVAHPAGALIGQAEKGAQAVPVRLAAEALRRNLLIIGKTQHGKSTLMEHLAAHWLRDPERAVVVVDPHGDLARRVVGLVPAERAAEVVYLDLADEARAAGLNLLDATLGLTPDELAEDFVDVGRALWQEFWGPRMQVPLGMGLRALAHANQHRAPEQQFTLLALTDLLLATPAVRGLLLQREVPLEERPDLRRYFLHEFDTLSASQREQVISPVLSKCRAFERTAAIRRLVGQPRSTLNLPAAIEARRIIVLNANAGLLGDDLAGFLGSLVVNLLRRVIMRQTAQPRTERVRVSVIADEFQTLTGVDFGALLGELQKNGGNFVLGTQSLDSLRRGDDGSALVGRLLAGVTTKIALQVNGEDARFLAEHELDVQRLQAESLLNLPPYEAYVKTIDERGRPIPVFSVRLAPPLAPDPGVVAAIQARRTAYTVPAAEADRLTHLSLNRFAVEYGREAPAARPAPVDAGAPPNAPDVMEQAARLPAAPVDYQRVVRAQADDPGRPRAPLPPGTTPRPAADAEAELAAVARRLTRRTPRQSDDHPDA